MQDGTLDLKLQITELDSQAPLLLDIDNNNVDVRLFVKWKKTLECGIYDYLNDEGRGIKDKRSKDEVVTDYRFTELRGEPQGLQAGEGGRYFIKVRNFSIINAKPNMEYVVAGRVRLHGLDHDFTLPPFAVIFDRSSNCPSIKTAEA